MDAKTKYKAKKIKIVFFDIDDTLRRKETSYMPESVKVAFADLKAKGILTGIATGRALYGVVPEIRDLEPDYFVTINGTYVIDKKKQEIFNQPLDPEVTKAYVDWCQQEGIAYGFAGKDKPVVSERSQLIDDAMIPVYGLCDVEPDFHLTNDVYHMWTFAENNAELELPKELAGHVRLVPWHQHSSDVVKNGISKASGVEEVLKAEKLKAVNAMMFGDGPNDMEIFDYVGLKIAMGNAVPEIKAKADYVTDTVEEDGIFNALEKLGMVEKQLNFPQLNLAESEGPVATIKTNHGDLVIKLFPDHAPLTVKNFVDLAESGYYDGVIFHRIIKDFMIQGGDPTGTGMGGESSFGGSFQDEFSDELYNLRGALSMANAGPNTNGSQFFIVQNSNLPYSAKELSRGGWPEAIAENYAANGGTPHLDRRHTVFGQLADEESYKVLDAIAAVETGAQDKPVEDVIIETVEVSD
ncbi:Cof-type HAD-IIB family hydrolase [Streptococcus loxodontisalivarius]|uniref:peptidylprolyl isomerase n=1 Tax=Streptococcus loxodontisalivarius TaxID=1349415 RepID=A0ABS2PQR6_9STRE|nr:Cof-type HAD-IIB family hydrolase [Streptococcus loxodontisalivarius]MBM7642216.1 peptidyl-prolyl cis-trans isomerase B (cyclophilin B) [Streptococcus loxodontisalivarius]